MSRMSGTSCRPPTSATEPQPTSSRAEQAPRRGAPPEPAAQATSVLRDDHRRAACCISVLAVVLALVVGGILIAADRTRRCRTRPATSSPGPATPSSAIWNAVGERLRRRCSRARSTTSRARLRRRASSPLTETLTLRHPADRGRPRRRARLPGRAVQHRRPGADPHRGGRRRPGRLRAARCRPVLHLCVAILAGLVGGAIWAGIVGLLKARTGAHEVIVTIMLNYVAFYLLAYLLHTPACCRRRGRTTRSRRRCCRHAVFPSLFGDHVQPDLGLPARDRRDGLRLVAARPLEPRLPLPRRRREPERRPHRRASTCKSVYVVRDGRSPARSSASPAPTRCSAQSTQRIRQRLRRRHRLRRDHRRAARPLAAVGRVLRRHPVRRLPGRRLHDAGRQRHRRSTSCSSSSR